MKFDDDKFFNEIKDSDDYESVSSGYGEIMHNDLLEMQEQSFVVINEKARERYPLVLKNLNKMKT